MHLHLLVLSVGCAILPVMRNRSNYRSFPLLAILVLMVTILAACSIKPNPGSCYQENCISNVYITNSQGLITVWLDVVDATGQPVTVCPQVEYTGQMDGLRNPEGDPTVSHSEALLFKCGSDTLLVNTLPFSAGEKRSTLVDITGLVQAPEDAGRIFRLEVTLDGVGGPRLYYEYVAPRENEITRAGWLAGSTQVSP